MAVPQSVTDALAALDADSTKLGGVVDALRAKIKTNMTQAEVDAVVSTMGGVSARLKGYAHDPDEVIPPEPLPVP